MNKRFLILTVLFLIPLISAQIVINEFVSDPNPGDNEWIELYNDGIAVDLTGWTLNDGASWTKTLSGTIGPNGFITIDISSK